MDAAQNIYVANTAGGNDILVFSSTQSGNVRARRHRCGYVDRIGLPSGVAVDSAGDIYVASINLPSNSSVVLEFAPGATGNATPTRALTSVASDALAGLAVDALDNLYIYTASGSQLAVGVVTPNQSGSSALSRTISSTTCDIRPRRMVSRAESCSIRAPLTSLFALKAQSYRKCYYPWISIRHYSA